MHIVCHLLCSTLIVLNVTHNIWSLTCASESRLPSNQTIAEDWTIYMGYIRFFCKATSDAFDICFFNDTVQNHRIYLII